MSWNLRLAAVENPILWQLGRKTKRAIMTLLRPGSQPTFNILPGKTAPASPPVDAQARAKA
jgi:hypothetical protein